MMMQQQGQPPPMGGGAAPAAPAPPASGGAPGNMYVLPQGSMQAQVDNTEYNLRPSSAGGSGTGTGKKYEETKYNHFKPEHESNTCPKQKKIVLDVNLAGFGNKLISIASTSILATLMNRILELDWSTSRKFEELFNFLPGGEPMQEVFRDANSTSANTFETVVSECTVKFTPINDYQHFWFLRHPQLFQKLDQSCDIIHIIGNAYWAPFLMDPTVFGEKAQALKSVFGEDPYHSIAKCHMSPKPQYAQESQKIVTEMKNSGGKWLSIHARAYYDYSGKASSKAFTCAKKLLETGVIKKVYFASESLKLIDMAKAFFQPFQNALYVSDKMVGAGGGGENMTNLDNEANVDDQHVIEWLTIGEADYCISPTFELSSFSNTGLFRGPCVFIPMKAYKDCDLFVQNTTLQHPKRLIFAPLNNPRAIRTWNKPVDLDKIWNSVNIVNASSQCERQRGPDAISKYWASQQC